MPPLTGVILNWKRPMNVARILSGWKASGLVSEAIVWNNNKDSTFRHDWAKVVNASEDFGLYTRFAATCLAKNECVLIQDDDIEAPSETLRVLLEAWEKDAEVIHGVFGRAPKPNGAYATEIEGDAVVPVVLTRILITRRSHAARFFEVAPVFESLQREGKPFGNGEDIIFSYVAMGQSGRLNRVHPVAVTELPSQHSIHSRSWKAHLAHRTRILAACEAWLKERRSSS